MPASLGLFVATVAHFVFIWAPSTHANWWSDSELVINLLSIAESHGYYQRFLIQEMIFMENVFLSLLDFVELVVFATITTKNTRFHFLLRL